MSNTMNANPGLDREVILNGFYYHKLLECYEDWLETSYLLIVTDKNVAAVKDMLTALSKRT